MADGFSINRGVHRLLLVTAVAVGVLGSYPLGLSYQLSVIAEANAASDEAARLQQSAKRWRDDDDSRFAKEARGQADLARMVSDVMYERVPTLGYAMAVTGGLAFSTIYFGGGLLWLAGRWVWLGFRG